MTKRVLDVGQCDLDHGNISQLITSNFDATVDRAHLAEDALSRLNEQSYDLVLINRILDRDGTAGLDVLRELGQHPAASHIPLMLVSNYDDAQQAAVAAGAVPGFGKAALTDPDTYRKLDQHLHHHPGN